MLVPVTPKDLGEQNKRVILDCVRKHGPVSRADLARLLDMSFPTVSLNVGKLIDNGFLLEAGHAKNTTGRKATLLEFNAAWGYVLSADIGRSQIRVMLSNLDGRELAYLKQDYQPAAQDNTIERNLFTMMESSLKQAGIRPEQVKHCTLGMPGIWDPQSGKLISVPFMAYLDLPGTLRRLDAYLHCPIIVENSVNLGAIGEKWRGAAQGYRDILYFSYGVGIGSALILDGELYKGINSAAGEIGYMIPDAAHMRDSFDEQGVMESLIAGSIIQTEMDRQGLGQDFERLMRESMENQQDARVLIQRVAVHIGMLLINTISVINAQVVVIGGRFGELIAPSLIPYWKTLLKNHVPFPPEIVVSALCEKASVIGGVGVGIRLVNDKLVTLGSNI